MNLNRMMFLSLLSISYIYSGPVVCGAACSACCAAVHAPEAAFLSFYLWKVGKCMVTCFEGLVPGIPSPIPKDPRDCYCFIAETSISFAPTA